jgi:hypothetical protein
MGQEQAALINEQQQTIERLTALAKRLALELYEIKAAAGRKRAYWLCHPNQRRKACSIKEQSVSSTT